MVILSLNLQHFGKFEDRTVAFRPGMNIITGPNSSGKTTIAEFIPAVFFGLSADSVTWQKFLPKDRDPRYGGSIQFLHEGAFYEVERSFRKGAEDVTVRVLPEGRELPFPETFLQEMLLGMSREDFLNTCMISPAHLKNHLKDWTEEGQTEEEKKAIAVRKHYARASRYLTEKGRGLQAEYSMEPAENVRKLGEEITLHTKESRSMEKDIRKNEAFIAKENMIIERLNGQITEAEAEKAKVDAEAEELSVLDEKNGKYAEKRPILGTIFLLLSVCFLAAAFLVYYFGVSSILNYEIPKLPLYLTGACVLFFVPGIVFFILMTVRRNRAIAVSERLAELEERQEELAQVLKARTELETHKLQVREKEEENEAAKHSLAVSMEALSEAQEFYDLNLQRSQEMEALNEEIQAVSLAGGSLSRLSEVKVHPEREQLVSEANGYYMEMNGGERSLFLNDEELLTVKKDETYTALPLLSERGALEALFSVQLASVQKKDPENVLPLILDDLFAGFDSERMNIAMNQVRAMKRQVIVFTCHARERQAL